MEFEPIDINFLINEPELKRDAKKVRDELRFTANDIGKSSNIATRQIETAFNSSTLGIQKNTQALAGQRRQYDGLGNSIAQITRELPAFTFSAQTGFLAISNNIPFLADEIARLKANNDELVASGQKGKSVFGQVAKSFLSWNTVLSVGVTLLTIYGPQIVKFITNLFKSKSAIDSNKASMDALNKAYESTDYQKGVRGVVEVRAAFSGAATDIDKKREALELYNEKLGNVLGTANNYNEAERIFRDKSDAYVKALLFRAAATEAVNEASKELIRLTKEEDAVQEEINAKGGVSSATAQFATSGLREERDQLRKEASEVETLYNRIINRLNERSNKLIKSFNLDFDEDGDSGLQKVIDERKKLLDKIAALDAEFAKKQLDTDAAEIRAIEQKFDKVRKLVEEFNNDPKTKASARIDLEAFDQLEKTALNDLDFRQDTRQLKEEIERQKRLFEDFEEYKKQFGTERAKERFAEELEEFRSYGEFIQQVYAENAPTFGAFITGDATAAQTERANLIIQAAEQEKRIQDQKYTDLLASLRTYEERRNLLIAQYQERRNSLITKGNDTAANELTSIFQKELDEMDSAFAKGTDEYQDLINGVEDLSTSAARQVILNARKMVDALVAAGTLSTEEAKKIRSEIDDIENTVDTRTAESLSKLSGQLSNLSASFIQLGQSLEVYDQGLADTITTIGELTQVTSEAAAAGASFASGDIVGGIASSINAIAGIFSIGARARESRRQAQAELVRLQQQEADGERQLNELQRERNIAKAQEVELSLKNIEAQRAALKLAEQQLAADQRKLFQELQNEQFITSSRTEKYGGFLGIGRKTRVVNEYADLLGLTFEEIEALYETGKLTDRAQELFQQLRDLREEGEDINGLLSDLETQSNELFTGTTAESISDSIIEGLRNGYDSFEDFAGDIEKILQNAILNSIKFQLLEEPLQRLFEQFAEFSESEGELSEEEAAAIRDAYNQQVENAIDRYNQLSDVLDLDELETTDQSGLQAAIGRELTEETASELTGLFRGQFDITKRHFQLHEQHFLLEQQNYQKTLEIIAIHTRIEANTRNTVLTLETAVTELKSIRDNTKKDQTARDFGKTG